MLAEVVAEAVVAGAAMVKAVVVKAVVVKAVEALVQLVLPHLLPLLPSP